MKVLDMISRTCENISTYTSAPGGGTLFNFSSFEEGRDAYIRAGEMHKLIDQKLEILRSGKAYNDK